MRTYIAIAVAAAAAGCASQPQPVVDNTPENPTAVFETAVSSTGIAGMFPFETTEKHYVRPNMRRDEHATRGTGRFSGFLVTRLTGQGDSTIARLDRKLSWTLNHGRKEYTECPVYGCPTPSASEQAAKPEERREEPKQQAEEGCVMRIASSKFDVTPTGQKRDLNGFNTEQYQVAWVVRMQDNVKRTTTSTVKFDVWTTPVNTQMRQAMDTEAAFGRALGASAPRALPAGGKPAADRRVMPPEMLTMMTGYLGSLNPGDRAAFARAVRELDRIKGHPISTKIEWLLEGNACGAKDEQAAQPSGAAGMLSGLAEKLRAKKEDTGPKPLLSFTIEVKQLGVQPVRDSVFSVPASYKLVKLP